jgi:hypothetical protein
MDQKCVHTMPRSTNKSHQRTYRGRRPREDARARLASLSWRGRGRGRGVGADEGAVCIEGGAEVEVQNSGHGAVVALPERVAELVGLEGEGAVQEGQGVDPI